MSLTTRRTMLFTLVALFSGLRRTLAAGASCAHCRCTTGCQKICRLVCEEKKVPVTCWGCKCEDFCLPGPGTPGCKHCENVCADCDPQDKSGVCVVPKRFVWLDWIPGCAGGIGTKKKLMKKVVTKTVPTYKWVVEDCCPACEAKVARATVTPGAEIPSPPEIAGARLVYDVPAEAPLPPQ